MTFNVGVNSPVLMLKSIGSKTNFWTWNWGEVSTLQDWIQWAPCLLWTQLCNLQLLLPPSMLLSPLLWKYHNMLIKYFFLTTCKYGMQHIGYWEERYTLGQSWTKTSLALVALLPICFSQSCTWERTLSRTKFSRCSGFLPVGPAPRLVSQLDQPEFCKGKFWSRYFFFNSK